MLDHICTDVERLGQLQVNDSGPAESSHQIIKGLYRRTSKRQRSAVDESFTLLNQFICTRTTNPTENDGRNAAGAGFSRTATKNIAIMNDTAHLVRQYQTIPMKKLMATADAFNGTDGSVYSGSYDWSDVDNPLRAHLQCIGPEAHYTLLNLLKEVVSDNPSTQCIILLSRSSSVEVHMLQG